MLTNIVFWRRARGSIAWLSALAGVGDAASFKPSVDMIRKADEQHRKCANRPGCSNPGLKKCGRCQAAYYCSPDCQRAHWQTPKPQCKKPETAAGTNATATESADVSVD